MLRPSSTLRWSALLLGCVCLLALIRVRSMDVWQHLQTGRWIVEHLAVPHQDLYAAPTVGTPWHYHEWLPGTLFYAVWSLGGLVGLQLFKVLLLCGCALALFAWVRSKGVPPALAALLVTVGCMAARFRFTIRPHVVAFVLLALMLWQLEQAVKGRRRSLIWIVVIEWVWACCHSSYVLGLALIGVTLAALVLQRVVQARLPAWSWRLETGEVVLELRWWIAAALGAIVVTCLTPYGLDLWRVPFTIEGMEATRGLISEWKAPALGDWASLPGAIAAGTVACGLALAARRVVPLRHWAMVLTFLYLAQRAMRFHAMMALVLACVLAAWIWTLVEQREVATRLRRALKARRALEAGALVAMLGGAALVVTLSSSFSVGLGADRLYPSDAVDFLGKLRVRGNVANPYVWGSYLIWRAWPGRLVLVDGRAELFKPDEIRKFVRGASPAQWRAFIRRFELNVALTFRDPQPEQLGLLMADRWVLVHWDDLAAVWVRESPEAGPDITRHRLAVPLPARLSPDRRWRAEECRDLARLAASAERSLLARTWLGRCYYGLGPAHHARAAEALRGALDLQPGDGGVWNDYAVALQALGRHREAGDAYQRALALDPEHAEAMYNYAGMLWSLGRRQAAAAHYRRFLRASRGRWPAAEARARRRVVAAGGQR